MITIEGETFGRKKSLFPSWSLMIDQNSEAPVTLRDLIRRIVLEEVKAFRERREERRMIRALTSAQISERVLRGKVDMGGREEPEGDADQDGATAVALQALEDGLYYVFIDEAQVEKLDDAVRLRDDSRVTFLRLVALAGG